MRTKIQSCPVAPSKAWFAVILILIAASGVSYAADANGSVSHSDPIAPVILGVTGILFFAVLGRLGARKFGMPSVLGELLMGVVLGNLGYYFGSELIILLRQGPELFDIVALTFAGQSIEQATMARIAADSKEAILAALSAPHGAELLQVAHAVDVFSRYGVIFLLFLVGLETSLGEMRKVGGPSLLVAVSGMLLPVTLGFLVIQLTLPSIPLNAGLFIAATLGATSVGITARVLEDMNKQRSPEARIILGAAVIDDILGLLLLAIVSGIIVSGGVAIGDILMVVALALAFLIGAVSIGPYFLHFIIKYLCRLDIVEAKMFTSYLFVMALAWMATLAGLATIVGAFTAGLVLQETYFKFCKNEFGREFTIKDLIRPLEVILVPIFFVLMGIQVKLETFLNFDVVIAGGVILVAAVVGKVAAGFVAGKSVNRLAIGFGMMPRGEVGLIFASIGKALGVIDDFLFSVIVLMVIVTTLVAPPLLKIALDKDDKSDS